MENRSPNIAYLKRLSLPYTELKAATYYSFLQGASSPQQMVEEAIRLGLKGIAITDLGGVYGAPKAYQALQRILEAGPVDFSLLIGSEIPLSSPTSLASCLPSLVFLAPTRAAYGAMCRLLTESHRNRPKGTGELPLQEMLRNLRELPHGDELMIFPQWEPYWFHHRLDELALTRLHTELETLFTLPNPFYLPLARYRDGLDQERTEYAKQLAARFPLLTGKIVAQQGALYHEASQQVVQDVLTSIREGQPLKELGLKLKRNAERRLKSPEEMQALFLDLPEAIHNTEVIRRQCTFKMSELRYQYPTEWIPKEHTAQSYLVSLCGKGLLERYPAGAPAQVLKLLEHELKLIEELCFADYFLTVYDIVDFAKSKKILCQGRGSAANSVVCYLLGITALDPMKIDLLFERFLSTERGEPPDIDVDFEHDRREEVIQYIYRKYGRNRAAMVSAVVTYRSRSALREVAKAFSVPVGTSSAREVQKLFTTTTEISEGVKTKVAEIVERILDFPRHLSIHSGGFTLSSDPIDTIVPVEPATMEGRTIVQWDKYDLDILGLLKIDVLALGMLSALRRSLEYTGHELYRLPHDDPATYRMIQKADTIGVFQIESRAQMAMLPRLKPEKFYDLVVEVALVRPGPIVGNMVHPYLKRRRGLEPVKLPDPRLKPILDKTYGVPIFQEQVMRIAVELAGFTPGEADRLRRAIGAWRSSGAIDEMGRKLQAGLKAEGIPDSFAQQIFDQIQGFSEYGFPESHAASFALLAYASSFIKCHYPAAFLCALLNSQPMGFYSPHSLVDDAKRHGVKVLPICINQSGQDCSMVDPNTVRLGLRYVRSLQESALQEILAARKERSFQNFQDFLSRTTLSMKALRHLALASAFECFGMSSRESLFEVLSLQEGLFREPEVQQDLFRSVKLAPMSLQEKVIQDYESTGLSTRAHPTEFLRQRLRQELKPGDQKWVSLNSQKLKESTRTGEWVKVMGLSVVVQRPPTAKGTVFATLEDEEGVIDLILHQKIFLDHQELIREEAFLWVSGLIQRDGDALQVIVKKIERIFRDASDLDDFAVPIAPGAHAKNT